MLTKGQKVTVVGRGASVNCPLVDIDYEKNQLWIRMPTGNVVQFYWNEREGAWTGTTMRIELRVYPKDNI